MILLKLCAMSLELPHHLHAKGAFEPGREFHAVELNQSRRRLSALRANLQNDGRPAEGSLADAQSIATKWAGA